MSQREDLIPWALTGTRDASYSDTKISEGWEIGEPPIARRWNAREYERDSTINYVKGLTESVLTVPPQATPQEVCGGRTNVQWRDPAQHPNVKNLGAEVRDSCLWWDADYNRYILLVLMSNGALYPGMSCGLYSGASTPSFAAAISPDYPLTPDEVYAICSDADFLYVVWAVTGGNFQVTKFDSDTLDAVWTTDTALAASLSTSGEDVRIIEADDDNIAVLLHANLFGVTTRTIGILTKSTGAGSYGTGSYVANSGDYFDPQNAKIVSDGTHVFWIQFQTGTGEREYFLMSASIADPTTSDYASESIGTISDSTEWSRPKGLLCVGESVLIATAAGYIRLYSTTDEELYPLYEVTLNQGTESQDGQDVVMGYDHQNIWVTQIIVDTNHAGRLTEIVYKIPAGAITNRMYANGYDAVTPASVAISAAVVSEETETSGKLVFDGQDMWLVKRTGMVYRIVNPGAW